MKMALLLIMFALLGANIFAAQPDDEPALLDRIQRMRIKQQGEEGPTRVQHFINTQAEKQCTAVQQSRKRVKDIDAERGETKAENVNITAGHGSLGITDNHGTINSDINIQIINQGKGEECP